jgi:hypothetical protein
VKLFKRASIAIAPLAVAGGLLAMPSSAGAQVDLSETCFVISGAFGAQGANPLVLVAEQTAGGACAIVANEVETVTSFVGSETGSG